jgi:bifunctional non-homologous end joining protein LigD
MLATASGQLSRDRDALLASLQDQGWVAQEKLDGVRGMAVVADDGSTRVFNRHRVDTTHRWPELTRDSSATVVLDGEIVVVGAGGGVDFPQTQRRDAMENARAIAGAAARHPVVFVAFDVTEVGGVNLRFLPLVERLAILDSLTLPPSFVAMPWTTDLVGLWREVIAKGGEGIVAKRPDGLYHAGRRPEWVKVKQQHRLSAVVTGWEPGRGARAGTFGALHLGLWDGQKIVDVGKVGTGWSTAESARLWGLVQPAPTFPVVEVEYHEVVGVGGAIKLRFPVFVGIRTDVELRECSTAQLAD